MAIFIRFFVVAFGFLCACFAASAVVAYGLLRPELSKLDMTTPEVWYGFWFIASVGGIVTPFFVFAPAFVAIVLAETFAWRSVLIYALGGGLIGALAYFLSAPALHLQGTGNFAPLTWELQLVVAGGIVGGFIYWLIAGRRAGAWRGV